MTNNNALPNIQPETYGSPELGNISLFEISDAGTILYCRTDAAKLSNEKTAETIGRNFFEEAAPFENTEEFRRHFNRFIKSNFPSENFTFNCRVKSRNIPARVMLVRISERSDNRRAVTTIVDIRKL